TSSRSPTSTVGHRVVGVLKDINESQDGNVEQDSPTDNHRYSQYSLSIAHQQTSSRSPTSTAGCRVVGVLKDINESQGGSMEQDSPTDKQSFPYKHSKLQ
ncbi:157_t:CDS:2, partial [Gigaspora margarita]